MTRTSLTDLNSHLFEQLERLNDEELIGEELEKEINRSKAITDVAEKIISNGSLMLKAIHEQNEYGVTPNNVPKMLIGTNKDNKND